jgi:catechol 2,3-dioxygenase
MYLFVDPDPSGITEKDKIASGVRIGHVNLRVADLDHAMNFYCDVLGLSVVYYAPSVGLPTVFLAFGDCHHHIALTWFYSAGSSIRSNHNGLNHFAIFYPDEGLLARAVTRLLDYGDFIEDARDHGGTLSVYLRDPDGNGIELYYDRPRSQWFDAAGQLVVKSEPVDLMKWLAEVWAGPTQPLASGGEITLMPLQTQAKCEVIRLARVPYLCFANCLTIFWSKQS